MTTERPKVSREVLEDRWRGAMSTPDGDEFSKLQLRLDRVVRELFEAVARRPWTGEIGPTSERPDLDGSGDVTDAMMEALHRTVLDEIDRRGLATGPTRLELAS